MQLTSDLLVACTVYDSDSQTLQSLASRGYHPIITPGKSPSRQRLDRVQWLRPPAIPHDITHYTLYEP